MVQPKSWRSWGSTRARVLGWYVVLLGVALVLALVAQRAFLTQRAEQSVDAELTRSVSEFQQVASGRDPDTGEPFGGDVGAIVNTYLSARVGVEGSGIVVYVQGETWAADVSGEAWARGGVFDPWGDVDEPTRGQVQTDTGTVRFLAAPVAATDQAAGVLVSAVALAPGDAEVTSAVRLAAAASLAVFLLASATAWTAAGNVLRPLRLLRRTAESITEDDLTARIDVHRDDEIGAMAATFNHMLDRLEEAFRLQRRFVDDAGHELRTPITIIRGQLEMLDDDPADRATAMALVDGELDRMTRIVDDLLVLAREHQPDFVDPRPVDLDDLMDGLGERASALMGRSVPVVASATAVVLLDEQRIVQAMLNLVRNARQHTPDDTDVAVGARMQDGALTMWVHDTGPGIPSEDLDTVLQRFGRGRSGPRSDGAGLGLSIVDAIARAHGGRVWIDANPADNSVGMRFPSANPPDGSIEPGTVDADRHDRDLERVT